MKESGCQRLLIGADPRCSGIPSRRDLRNQADRWCELAERLHSFGVGARFRLVASGDTEGGKELREIQRAARGIRAVASQLEASVALYRPHPGTESLKRVARDFAPPESLAAWGRVGPGAESAWIPPRVLRRVERFNFYLGRAHQLPQPGLGRLVRSSARARVRVGFYGLDLERRLAELGQRVRERLGSPRPPTRDE
jgi:hypothetical protein